MKSFCPHPYGFNFLIVFSDQQIHQGTFHKAAVSSKKYALNTDSSIKRDIYKAKIV